MKKPYPAFVATKKFDQQLHEENDGPAKDAVMNYISTRWGKQVE